MARTGSPELKVTTNPEIYLVAWDYKNKMQFGSLIVGTQETANRLAKAFSHAVELCGGGDDSPF
jgi:hypothetical protein